MKHRIQRIGVLKLAVIVGIAYAAMTLLFVPFMLLFVALAPPMDGGFQGGGEWLMGPAFMLLAPLIYGVFGFITGALAAGIYNVIAMMVGGVEVELEAIP